MVRLCVNPSLAGGVGPNGGGPVRGGGPMIGGSGIEMGG